MVYIIQFYLPVIYHIKTNHKKNIGAVMTWSTWRPALNLGNARMSPRINPHEEKWPIFGPSEGSKCPQKHILGEFGSEPVRWLKLKSLTHHDLTKTKFKSSKELLLMCLMLFSFLCDLFVCMLEPLKTYHMRTIGIVIPLTFGEITTSKPSAT